MTVYVMAQLKMTDRAAYDRYQARFFDVFRKFNRRLLSADQSPSVVEGDWNRGARAGHRAARSGMSAGT